MGCKGGITTEVKYGALPRHWLNCEKRPRPSWRYCRRGCLWVDGRSKSYQTGSTTITLPAGPTIDGPAGGRVAFGAELLPSVTLKSVCQTLHR